MSNIYKKRTIRICRGSGCNSMNAGEIHNILKDLLQEYKLSKVIKLKLTGCQGFCQFGPQIIIEPDNVLYVKLKPVDIKEIIENADKVINKEFFILFSSLNFKILPVPTDSRWKISRTASPF